MRYGRDMAKRQKKSHQKSKGVNARPVQSVETTEDAEENILTVSPEEFGRMRSEFFAAIPGRLAELKKAIVSEMASFDAFDVLTNLLMANMPLNSETYRESEHEGMFAVVEYAGLLLLERPSREGTDVARMRPIDVTVIPGWQHKLREMLSLSAFLAMHAVGGEGDEPQAIDEVRVRIAQRELFLRNPTYDWQEEETLRGLFGEETVASDLREVIGFDAEDALSLSDALWTIGVTRFRERAKISSDLGNRVEAETRRVLRGERPKEPSLAEVVGAIAAEPSKRRKRTITNLAVGYAWSRAGDAFQVTAADLAVATGRPASVAASFLSFFALEFGQVEPTLALRGSHPLRERPLIHDGDGHYLCTYHGNVLFALRRRLEDSLKPVNGDPASAGRWERYNRVRRRYLEGRAVSLLGNSLKTPLAWVNPKYAIVGGDRIEIDGLVLLDTVAFVIEAKGAPLSKPARRSLEPRLKRDIEAILEKATDQTSRLTAAIEREEQIEFWDSDGKRILIDQKELSRVFAIVVTLDDLSGLSTLVSALVEAGLLDAPEPLPWIVSLHELEVVLDLLEFGAQFPHFLMRRRRINELKRVYTSDELDFFVYYLLRGLYFEETFDASDAPDRVFLQSMTDDVDAYYFWRHGLRKSKARKPSTRLDPLTSKVVKQLDTQRPPGFLEASIAFFEMSDESRREFARKARRAVALSAKDGGLHDVTFSFVPIASWGITVMTAVPGRKDELRKRLSTYVTLKKHQLGADYWVGIAILIGMPGAFHGLVVDYAPWRPDSKLDEMVAQAFAVSPPRDQLSQKLRAYLLGHSGSM